ncbi:MAG: helix-turn-helix domain-containing protein [Bacteroidota bacterium]
MPATIITLEDLHAFKTDLLEEIKNLLNSQSSNSSGDKWIKSPQLRKMLKISHGTLQQLRINGTIPFRKVGGIIYYNVDEINKIIDSNKFQNGSKA